MVEEHDHPINYRLGEEGIEYDGYLYGGGGGYAYGGGAHVEPPTGCGGY
jgi:hypothetical protein